MRNSTPALALLAALALGACDTLAEDPGSEAPSASASPKLRHWDLANAGVEPGRAAALGDSVEMIVTFAPGVADPVSASSIVFGLQEVVKRDYYRDTFTGVAVTVPAETFDQVLDGLVASDLVSYVEPDLDLRPPMESVTYAPLNKDYDGDAGEALPTTATNGQVRLWSLDLLKADGSHQNSGNKSGTTNIDVYIIDTELAPSAPHNDLNIVERRSFLPAGAAAAPHAHGTHIAGIIGGIDDNDGLVGVAPGARLHALSVVAADGTVQMSTLLNAVEYVTEQKRLNPTRPMVVNFSLGAYVGTTQLNALDEAIQRSIALGVTYVVSAGNQGVNASMYSPAHVPEVITVGAYDSGKKLADYSNYGSFVDILAPGTRIQSMVAGTQPYGILSGTSMAAPHVTGAAALILELNPLFTPAQVRARMMEKDKEGEIDTSLRAGTTRNTVWYEFL